MIKRKICLHKIVHPNAAREEIRKHILEEDSVDISQTTIADILQDSDRWTSTGTQDKSMIQPKGRIVRPPVKPYNISQAIPVCQRLLATLQSHDSFSEKDYGRSA